MAKFVNVLMRDGKKSVAESILYGAFDIIDERGKGDPVELFESAPGQRAPAGGGQEPPGGGATYQVPVEVRPTRRDALAMRWLVESARRRGEKSMTQRLAGELMDAADNRGGAAKKREDVHRMAEANKAFSHYRF